MEEVADTELMEEEILYESRTDRDVHKLTAEVRAVLDAQTAALKELAAEVGAAVEAAARDLLTSGAATVDGAALKADPPAALSRAVIKTDELLLGSPELGRLAMTCGTTSTVVYFHGTEVWTACSGDSRAVKVGVLARLARASCPRPSPPRAPPATGRASTRTRCARARSPYATRRTATRRWARWVARSTGGVSRRWRTRRSARRSREERVQPQTDRQTHTHRQTDKPSTVTLARRMLTSFLS